MTRGAAVRAEGLSKRFRIGSRVGLRAGAAEEELWALRDLCFQVDRGEAVAIVGRNGAGKSTLLRILARITEPSAGRATILGRVGSLLEVGTGFHPELTGRENVYLNGAILGMRKAEIDARFDAIVAFSDVERFLDTPVKRYSSGMRVRLAFAVAAHLEPEILIIDEVLAVGDAEFQRRCLGSMSQAAGSGRTVLFVSHNMTAVRGLCSRALWLDQGRLRADGPVDPVVDGYLRSTSEQARRVPVAERRDRGGSGDLRITRLEVLAGDPPSASQCPATGRGLALAIGYAAARQEPLKNVRLALAWSDAQGQRVTAVDTRHTNTDFDELPPAGELRCEIPELPLAPGLYRIDAWASVSGRVADEVPHALELEVGPGDFFGTGRSTFREKHGPLLLHHSWRLERSVEEPEAMLP